MKREESEAEDESAINTNNSNIYSTILQVLRSSRAITLCIVGPKGAGKSSTVNTLLNAAHKTHVAVVPEAKPGNPEGVLGSIASYRVKFEKTNEDGKIEEVDDGKLVIKDTNGSVGLLNLSENLDTRLSGCTCVLFVISPRNLEVEDQGDAKERFRRIGQTLKDRNLENVQLAITHGSEKLSPQQETTKKLFEKEVNIDPAASTHRIENTADVFGKISLWEIYKRRRILLNEAVLGKYFREQYRIKYASKGWMSWY